MEHENIEQECPFCPEKWGTCDHYEILVGLEEEASDASFYDAEQNEGDA